MNQEDKDNLLSLHDILSDSLTPKGITQWLFANNRVLEGKVPIEELRKGHTDEVFTAARSFINGDYL